MDRKKTKIAAARSSLAGLSRRRKIAAVILLLLLGVVISDTGTTDNDATVSHHEHGASHTDMDEISALLDVFNEEQTNATAKSSQTEPEATQNTTAVTHFDQADQSPGMLTIPPATPAAAESPFQNVSQSADYPVAETSTEDLPADDETALDLILPDPDVATTIEDDAFEPEEPPSQIIVRPAGSRPTTSKPSRTSIRFTGTIYPVQ